MVSGRLIVKSHDAFASIIKQLKSDPNKPLVSRFKETIGLKNYEEFQSFINSKDGNLNENDTLVIDPDFAVLLNAENAIQVENTIYRITPFGTFVYIADKADEANEAINNFNNGEIVDEIEMDEYLYEIEEGVFRYDTYQEMSDCFNLN